MTTTANTEPQQVKSVLTPKQQAKRARKIGRLLEKSIKFNERGKAFFDKSNAALEAARAAGATPGEPVELPETGQRMVVKDHFTSNVVYRAARFPRFTVEEYREPREPKNKKGAA